MAGLVPCLAASTCAGSSHEAFHFTTEAGDAIHSSAEPAPHSESDASQQASAGLVLRTVDAESGAGLACHGYVMPDIEDPAEYERLLRRLEHEKHYRYGRRG